MRVRRSRERKTHFLEANTTAGDNWRAEFVTIYSIEYRKRYDTILAERFLLRLPPSRIERAIVY